MGESEWIALAGVLIAVISLLISWRQTKAANKKSQESLDISRKAVEISKAANQIAENAEKQRQSEIIEARAPSIKIESNQLTYPSKSEFAEGNQCCKPCAGSLSIRSLIIDGTIIQMPCFVLNTSTQESPANQAVNFTNILIRNDGAPLTSIQLVKVSVLFKSGEILPLDIDPDNSILDWHLEHGDSTSISVSYFSDNDNHRLFDMSRLTPDFIEKKMTFGGHNLIGPQLPEIIDEYTQLIMMCHLYSESGDIYEQQVGLMVKERRFYKISNKAHLISQDKSKALADHGVQWMDGSS